MRAALMSLHGLVLGLITITLAGAHPASPSKGEVTPAIGAAFVGAAPAKSDTIHHDLSVRLDPAAHRLSVTDTVTLPPSITADQAELGFTLHGGLAVTSPDPTVTIEAAGPDDAAHFGINEESGTAATEVPLTRWIVHLPGGESAEGRRLVLHYEGTIHHPLMAEEQEYARSFSRTPGLIDEQGVVLSGSTWWVPGFAAAGDLLATFRLTTRVPADWDVVSQGQRTEHRREGDERLVTWDSVHPMDEIYLIAARFVETRRPAGSVMTYAFLREPDPNLAAKYLEATAQYIEMYRKLIGPYPYGKFALIENFWETGYGMPSFTLLGPKIIRFPFILHSSYPHEILHNWWGNSVFVAYEKGNWCEGLTAYLADHLIKEGQGRGAEYRRDTLKRYLDYVREAEDFPLTAFRSRHSSASEAVGYGKSAMLFHMLRRRLGDELFSRGLQVFYRRMRFKMASFDDLARIFSDVAGEDLTGFFAQWVERTGALELALGEVTATSENGSGPWQLSVAVRQTQPGEAYAVAVPIAVLLEGEERARLETLPMAGKEAVFVTRFDSRPVRVQLDPRFDLFRRLDRSETPPTIGQLFGAPEVTLVLPGQDDPLGAAWEGFAASWTGSEQAHINVLRAADVEQLPDTGAVWLLGARNPLAGVVARSMATCGASISSGTIEMGDVKVESAGHCFVAVARHPAHADGAVGWIGADREAALPGLARKLPHYGKYSYLTFGGDEPTNDGKGTWPAVNSPLSRVLVEGPAPPLGLPAGEPLARLEPVFDADELLGHVEALASDALEGRGVGSAGLEKAGNLIAAAFEKYGLVPGGDNETYYHSWSEPDGPEGRPVVLRNVIGVLPGKKADWKEQSVVIGAHYDHLGRGWPDVHSGDQGRIHNGADDNASGVAVMLEVARLLAAQLEPDRTVIFAAFSGEEWGLKGSREYVRSMTRWPAKQALAMINLDTVGRIEGKKLTVLGAGSASEWAPIAMGIGFTTGVESTAVRDDPGGSDQKSFLEAGVPAVQLFSGAHTDYHRPTDDVEKIDVQGLVKVATFLREAIVYLSEREQPLTSSLSRTAEAGTEEPGGQPSGKRASGRRVSLGTMPDFAFEGPGVRVAAVIEGSPAAKAGVKDGDIVLAIDGSEVADLRAYAQVLAGHAPGDTIRLRVRRAAQVLELEATLVAR